MVVQAPRNLEEMQAMSDEDFAIFAAEPTPAAAGSLGLMPEQLSDQQVQSMIDEPDKPENQFSPLAPLSDTIEAIGASYGVGQAQMERNILYSGAVWAGKDPETLEFSQEAELDLTQKRTALQAYTAKYGEWNPVTWVPLATESLPAMVESLKGAGAGAAVGAAVGGLVGRAPGARFGAEWGGRIGAGVASGRLMSGELYEQLITSGADKDNAKIFAAAGGAVNGVLESLGLEILAGAGRKAVVTALKSETGKQAIKEFVTEYLKDSAFETATETLQEVTNVTAQVVESILEQSKDLSLSPADAWKRIVEATIGGAKASLILVGGSKAAGGAVGLAGRTAGLGEKPAAKPASDTAAQTTTSRVAAKVASGKATIVEALELLKEGFNKPEPTAEDIKQTKEATMADTLDALAKPGVDEKGKVVQTETGPQIQAGVEIKVATGAEVYKHGTTPQNKASILASGALDPEKGVRQYGFSEYGADTIYAAKSDTVWFTDPGSGRMAKYEDSLDISLKPGTRIAQIRNATDWNNLAAQVGLSGDELESVLAIEYLNRFPTEDAAVQDTIRNWNAMLTTPGSAWYGFDSVPKEEMDAQIIKTRRLFQKNVKYDKVAKAEARRVVGKLKAIGVDGIETFDENGPNTAVGSGTPQLAVFDPSKVRVTQTETGPQIQAGVTKEAPLEDIPGMPTLETKGRETNVKDTLKTIDAAINDTERALISATADEKPTAAIMNKLDKLYEKRGVAQFELEQLTAGVVEDVTGKNITVKADRIAALRAKAAKDAIKKFQQGVREGAKTARDTVKQVQAEVDSLIRASDLPAKDKGKFLGRLRNITTEAQLTRALPQINQRLDALIEKDALRTAKKNLATILKRAKERKTKRPEGKYTADVQLVLDTYTKMLADPKAVEAALNVVNPTTEREQLDQMVATHVGDIENKSSAEIQSVVDEMKAIIETGKAKRLEKTINARLEAQQDLADALASVNGDKPIDSANMATSRARLKKWGSNWVAKIDAAAGRYISTWSDLMDIISQNDKNRTMEKLMDVFPAVVAEQKNQRQQFDAFIDRLVESVEPLPGEKPKKTRQRALDRLVTGGAKPQEWGTFTNPEGQEVPLVVTRNEAAAIYAQSFDPDAEAGWKTTYTKPEDVIPGQVSTMELLENVLDDLDKQLIQGIFNHFSEYHERLNTEWEDETGTSMPKNPFYSGQLRRIVETKDGPVVEQVTAFDEYNSRSLKPGSTFKRVTNTNPIAVTDLYTNAMRQLHETEHWMAWRKPAKKLRNVFGNSKVRNTIRLKYGEGMMRTIDLHIDNMLGTKIKTNEEALGWMKRIRHNAGTAFVGGKALSAAKQFSGVLLFADHVSPLGYIRHSLDFYNLSDIARKIKIMESSELMKSRGYTMDVSVIDQIKSTDPKRFKDKNPFTEFLMGAVKFGDKATIWAGGWSVYAETLEKTGSHEQAIQAFEKAFNATQSSGTVDQVTQFEASGEIGKTLSLFTKNAVQIVNMERRALRRAIAQPSAKNIALAAKTFAVTRASQFLFQLAASAPVLLTSTDDDELNEQLYKLFRATMFGAWTGLPLIGDVLDSTGTLITNITFDAKEKIWKPGFLPFDVAGDALTAFKQAVENITSDKEHDWVKIVGDGLETWTLVAPKNLGGGLPTKPLWGAATSGLFFEQPNEDASSW